MKRLTLLIALATLAAPTAPAQEEKKDTTAKADEIIAKMIEASGGRKAYEKVKNRVSTGKMTMAAMGVAGTLKQVEAAPARSYMVIEMTEMGLTQEQGIDGKHAWAKDTMSGARLMEGDELVDALAESRFNGILHWKKVYPERSYEGETTLKGKKCHKIVLQFASGNEQTWYIDSETNLHYGIERVHTSPMGEIDSTVVFKDYKEVDGLMMPHRLEIDQMGNAIVMEFTSIEHNVELAKDAFALPDDVKKLIERKEKKQAEEQAGNEDGKQAEGVRSRN